MPHGMASKSPPSDTKSDPPPELESEILQSIRKEFGRLKNGRLLRFNTGGAKDEHGRIIKFGVPGFPDLAGILNLPDKPGHWIGLEVKTATGRIRPEQTAFHQMITIFGGSIAVVRSLEEAKTVMKSWGAEW